MLYENSLAKLHVRRIVITGENTNWNRTTAVSIEDIPIVFPLRVQNTEGMFALIKIPPEFLDALCRV
jgi:hypothetical protein